MFYTPGEFAFNERLLWKKKIESNVVVDMGTVPLTESVFFSFLAAIQKSL